MVSITWLLGLWTHRPGRLVATAAGVALAVGLLASIGVFVSSSKATMTARSITRVAVDWQVEVQAGGDVAAVEGEVASLPGIRDEALVEMADVSGLEAMTGSTTQTTGPGVVVGWSQQYPQLFPDAMRVLAGRGDGVLLAQQTAANLHALPGDVVNVARPGLPTVSLTVDGVIDLPQADSLFQKVGAPPGAQLPAPPDNVLVIPLDTWHTAFDPVAVARPDLVRHQVHVELGHNLPHDPAAAYSAVTGKARNLEAKLTGAGLVGDNLGAALSSARADALYAQVMFLFLGVPGAAVAALLTAAVASAGRERRRKEYALLRVRGASSRALVRLAIAEALSVGVVGAAFGLGLAVFVGRTVLRGEDGGVASATLLAWSLASAGVGLAIAVLAIAGPARSDARSVSVSDARRVARPPATAWWERRYLDVAALALALTAFWATSRNGYTLVLAVEGVPTISVSYWAFLGPALLWLGSGLLIWRLAALVLAHGQRQLTTALRPVSGPLSETVASSMRRHRNLLARGTALAALAVAFAASTAVFDATFAHQAEVDAVLTNGADVTVAESPGADVGPGGEAEIAGVSGVRSVEPLQHRFAYVGSDLQDLYGVDPTTIVDAGKLQDAYFSGGSARELMATLGRKPDSVLVSSETVRDFQLVPGDQITLRLQDGRTKQYLDVPFHYVGVANEFPTAPSDSFLVANAAYVASATGSNAVGLFLVDTGGNDPATVASGMRQALGPEVAVNDIASSRKVVGSSLTAVDLAGLTKIEVGFGLALVGSATGLVVWLGLVERRRTFAIASALGASRRQLGGFVWGEALFVTAGGLVAGVVAGWALSVMLVTALRGVFDPAPSGLTIPWDYLIVVGAIALTAVVIAAEATITAGHRSSVQILRTL